MVHSFGALPRADLRWMYLVAEQKTGRKPTAGTYEILLRPCSKGISTREKEIAFFLVEQVKGRERKSDRARGTKSRE